MCFAVFFQVLELTKGYLHKGLVNPGGPLTKGGCKSRGSDYNGTCKSRGFAYKGVLTRGLVSRALCVLLCCSYSIKHNFNKNMFYCKIKLGMVGAGFLISC